MKFGYRMKNYLVMVSLLVIVQPKETEANGECKDLVFLLKEEGYYLRHHSIENLTDATQDMCRMVCYTHDSCISYNYFTKSARCEINDADKYSHPEDLVRKAGSVYVGVDNACSTYPCPSNATCQPNLYTQSYSCLCHPGFNGSDCTDIDECALDSHNCSINHTCINTAGSYDCICKPGYEEQGITCIDIDECETHADNCSADRTCVNTEGSFECRCNNGSKMFENNCMKIVADYDITLYTSNLTNADTRANVFIRLHGYQFKEYITSLKVKLPGPFQKGSVDTITINGTLPNMESLYKITMSQDYTGSEPGWKFDKVIVDNKTRRMKYTYRSRRPRLYWKLGFSSTALSVDIYTTRNIKYYYIVTKY